MYFLSSSWFQSPGARVELLRNTAESSLCDEQFVWRVPGARSPPLKLCFGLLVVHLFNGSYSAKQSRKTATFAWRRGWILASQSSVNVDDVTSDF